MGTEATLDAVPGGEYRVAVIHGNTARLKVRSAWRFVRGDPLR